LPVTSLLDLSLG